MPTSNTADLQELEKSLFQEVATLLSEPSLAEVVEHGLSPLYGPLMVRPDLGIITFQGGGADRTIQTCAPDELLYLADPYKFGGALRRYMGRTGLSNTLRKSTVAHAAVFPQAPTSLAGKWLNPSDPSRRRWVDFSRKWNERLIRAQRPKALLFFGEKASRTFGIEWAETERNHAQHHLTFGKSDWHGIPAFYFHHLSIGCPESEAMRCLERVAKTVGV
jgi:hypothetical protein